MQAEETTTLGK